MAADFELILGRACSGKTHALFERAAEAAEPEAFVIVADQATFETERGLAQRLGGGLFNCGVYSWVSLARGVLDSVGDRRAYLAPQGKVMLVRRAVDACAHRLRVFGRAAEFRGFPAECDELFRRFKRCAVTPEMLAEAAERLPESSPLAAKLADLALIYGECERLMSQRYIDSEDMMNALCEHLARSRLAGARVFIDGGDTMNEQGYRVFREMLTHCKSVAAALCVDPEARDRGLFAPEQRVLGRMEAIAHEVGSPIKITLLERRREGRKSAMIHLEENLFAHPKNVFNGVPAGMSVYEARDRMDEAAQAAERIRAAAANGMRYRDMAVVVSDLAGYAPVISRVFSAYGIPYFTDAKRTALAYPAAELILASLQAAEHGFDAANVLRVVKTGYCDMDTEAAERFENYLVATGFTGRRLTEPFPEDAPAGVEQARKAVMEPLIALRESVRTGTAAERTRAVYDHVERMGLYQKQKALCEKLHEDGQYQQEEENAQVLNVVMELLDQLYVILGEGEIGLTRFISVVREGLASYELGVIPTTCDQVLVGNIGRTRARRVRMLQVLGMNEGLFPKRRADDGVIDDTDLGKLSALGMRVWSTSRELAESDSFDIYRALSKPTEELWLSYPVSADGEKAMPCSLLASIGRIFPDIRRESGMAGRLRGEDNMALAALARGVRKLRETGETDGETAALYARFRERGFAKELSDIGGICFGGPSPAPFGRDNAAMLYGRALYGSASRLETFNRCPFFHFMRYGMEAREREEHREKNTDVGSFYHEALEAYVDHVRENGLDWAELDDERVFDILRELMPPLMAAYKNGILYESARQRARLVTLMETVRATCCAVTRQIARGSFRPSGSEVRFGGREAMFPPLRIELPSGEVFFIGGIIDRIDTWNDGQQAHSRIIDYKTGGKGFDFAELKAGLQLQLPLYAAAVAAAERAGENENVRRAARRCGDTVGMYYMPIRDVVPDEDGAARELTDELMEEFRLSGLSLRDPEVVAATDSFDKKSFVINAHYNKEGEISGTGMVARHEYARVLQDAQRIAAATLEGIMQGRAEVSPARKHGRAACRFCPYGSVCRFDPNDGAYRRIGSLGPDGYFGRE